MQVLFKDKIKIALVGQKVDSTSCVVVSSTCSDDKEIDFGSFLVFDDKDKNLCKIPTAKSHLDKPLGIALREFHGLSLPSKSPLRVLRQGRIWVKCSSDVAPSDPVYISINQDGAVFTNKETQGAMKIKGAIYLEEAQGDLAPIEINFLGGAQ